MEAYVHSKARLRTALVALNYTHFGVRQKYRVNIFFFTELRDEPLFILESA